MGIYEQATQVALMTITYSYFEFHQGLADATSLLVG